MRFAKLYVLAAAALLTLAGCGADEPAVELESRQFDLTRVCGADKYMGPQGVDVSTYQPNYNWAAQAAAGVKFGYARVSNGTQIIDDQFDRNWPEMKAQGIYRGVYQYFRPGQDAAAQANLVVNKVGRLGRGDMPAMIDVETADGMSPSVVAAKVKEWLDIVEAGTGKKPAIYTGAYFWQDNVQDTTLGEYPLWIANYGADCPLVPDGWTTWTMWQYCDGNTDYCTNGMGFDRNVYNGTNEQLDELANGTPWAAEVVAVSPMQTVKIGEAATVFVELENTGAGTWDASTKLATTDPRDRDSLAAAPDWEAPHRVAAVNGMVAPGETYRFEFQLIGHEVGALTETFGLVQEGVAWFADAGGPADDAIVMSAEVLPADAEVRDMGTTDPGEHDMGGSEPVTPVDMGGVEQPTADGLPPLIGPSPGVNGGCSQVSGASSAFGLVLLLLGAVLRRRR